ncbi:uncharacterized protein N7482_000346 [Penicillium canariense]|uniref:Uncharacterized protein n=1 Tax=Penicillium canariense TaxID=189055 RepID=A0A9W9LSV1_9EURO|nr:uncharacterized protein N7482_000346 [Penicillium canariense]KAJ5174469.1 hypothetical protein N7482_000346 [Penicillium canariense]
MAKPTLEGLPAELLLIVLSQVSDWESLRSIVHASPTCHSVYLIVRSELLCGILKRQYGALLDLPEAILAIRSKGLFFFENKEKVIALLDTWRRREEIKRLSSMSATRLDEPDSLEETIDLLWLHKELQFFLKDYSTNVPRPSWIDPAQWNHELPIQMSHAEQRRFMRALCRLYTHANIFGQPEKHPYDGCELRINTFDDEEAYRIFFGTMPPWEYEEMGCVWSYLRLKYDPVYKEITDTLSALIQSAKSSKRECFWFRDVIPKDQYPPNWSVLVDCVDCLEEIPDYTDGLASIGPGFLYRVLHAKPLVRRNMVMANLDSFPCDTFIGLGLGISWDERLPLTDPADRHDVPDFEHYWSNLPPLEQPNLGWKRLGLVPHTPDQTLQEALEYFHNREREAEWLWGYALWDAERLKAWKAPQV